MLIGHKTAMAGEYKILHNILSFHGTYNSGYLARHKQHDGLINMVSNFLNYGFLIFFYHWNLEWWFDVEEWMPCLVACGCKCNYVSDAHVKRLAGDLRMNISISLPKMCVYMLPTRQDIFSTPAWKAAGVNCGINTICHLTNISHLLNIRCLILLSKQK